MGLLDRGGYIRGTGANRDVERSPPLLDQEQEDDDEGEEGECVPSGDDNDDDVDGEENEIRDARRGEDRHGSGRCAAAPKGEVELNGEAATRSAPKLGDKQSITVGQEAEDQSHVFGAHITFAVAVGNDNG